MIKSLSFETLLDNRSHGDNCSHNDTSHRPFCRSGAIFIPVVSNSYYGMLRWQLHIALPPEHPIITFVTIEIKMAAVSVKRSIGVDAQKSQNTISTYRSI